MVQSSVQVYCLALLSDAACLNHVYVCVCADECYSLAMPIMQMPSRET